MFGNFIICLRFIFFFILGWFEICVFIWIVIIIDERVLKINLFFEFVLIILIVYFIGFLLGVYILFFLFLWRKGKMEEFERLIY